jgi:Na+/H+ antiporter NhaD/arsenite permease-like protein
MRSRWAVVALVVVVLALVAVLTPAPVGRGGPALGPVRVEFILFALVLAGVAVLHQQTLQVAASGLAVLVAYRLTFTRFDLAHHLVQEWRDLLNLLGLLLGFALLAKHFEATRIPDALPAVLPDGWTGGLWLLVLIAALSSFLDNIAAAMIGGTLARVVFRGKVHVGFLAAIVAASNAGGAGSVVGDTTTTMMWLAGVDPRDVLHAFVGSGAALAVFGVVAARQQHALSPITKDAPPGVRIDRVRLGIVALVLGLAVVANVLIDFPAAGVWVALLLGATVRRTAWGELRGALRGALFLLSLVLCASLMPVDELPAPTRATALGLGFVSAVFDNIPLTKLALEQDHYDWGVLAYAVGFGGSMLWFGSSAGVALAGMFPDGKSVGRWLRDGWHIIPAYVVGFAALCAWPGWQPHPKGVRPRDVAPVSSAAEATR